MHRDKREGAVLAHLILVTREVHVEMGRLDRSFRHLGDAFCVRYVVVNDRMLPSQPLLQKGADLWTSIDTIHHTRDTYALTQTHKGAMHREQSAGDGQRAHRRKRCVDSDVRQTAWTVPLQDRCGAAAIWANAIQAESMPRCSTAAHGCAHRLPRLRCNRPNSQLQRRTLS